VSLDRDAFVRALERTALPEREARQLPPAAFTSAEAFAMDLALFRRSWLPVAHVSELAEVGSFAALEIAPGGPGGSGGDRVVVVRTPEGELAALFDRCLHRGTPLSTGAGGRFEGLEIVCPYHGLAYDLGGRARPRSAPRVRLGGCDRLPRAALTVRHGFVFVRMQDGAPPLEGEPEPPWLARAELSALRLGRRTTYEVRANWKLLVENFQESQHFPFVHPALEAETPASASSSHDFGGRWLGGSMDLAAGRETVSTTGLLRGRRLVAAAEDQRVVRDAHLFPGWLTSLQPDYFLSYRLGPRAPDLTTVTADIYFLDGAGAAAADEVFAFWDTTNDEDRSICERQQRGVGAAGHEPAPYADGEDGVHGFDRRVAEIYLEALPGDDGAGDAPARAPIHGVFGHPYVDLGHLLRAADLAEIDREVTRGLLEVEARYTGGSLKWMGVVAPWQMDDGYLDLMDAIRAMSRDEYEAFVALGDDPQAVLAADRGTIVFGDETEHLLTRAQERWLSLRHGVYFPWKVCYHLLENDKWEDKHSGAGKDFGEEAKERFPKTIEHLRSLPFEEIGRVVVFGLEPNDHAPLHRDTEPGRALSVAQSINIDPRGTKRFYLQNAEDAEPLVVEANVYWFNDMDYHGVLPDPCFRYSIRVDGVFERAFLRDLERRARRG
jgi:Rieske 2Fe-2S family protein